MQQPGYPPSNQHGQHLVQSFLTGGNGRTTRNHLGHCKQCGAVWSKAAIHGRPSGIDIDRNTPGHSGKTFIPLRFYTEFPPLRKISLSRPLDVVPASTRQRYHPISCNLMFQAVNNFTNKCCPVSDNTHTTIDHHRCILPAIPDWNDLIRFANWKWLPHCHCVIHNGSKRMGKKNRWEK